MVFKASRKINPNKLLHSKWTAVSPRDREKHFLVVGLIRDDSEEVKDCVIEAVINQRQQTLNWRDLLEEKVWKQGWS